MLCRSLWVPALVLTILTAGCAGFLDKAGTADVVRPLGEPPAPDCPEDAPEDRLLAWRGGPTRTGFYPCATVPDAIQLDWRLGGINKGDHGAAKASPVPWNGSWLVPGDTGMLTRVGSHGRVDWSAGTVPSANGIHGTPAIHDGTAFIGAYDGALYAFDLATGEQLWRTRLGGYIGSSPVYHAGEVYVAVETAEPSGLVAIVNATTGEEVWRDERVTNHPHSSIALSAKDGLFVVGANDGVLYAWNLSTREPAWTFETGGAIKGPVAIHDGAAFFGSWDESVYRVSLEDGHQTWRFETDGNVMHGPAIDPRTGTVFAGGYDARLYALDAATGEERWRRTFGGPLLSSPVIAGDRLLVGSHDEHLYALEARDGSLVWSFQAEGHVSSTAAIMGDRIAFTDRADEQPGRLYVLEPVPG